MKQQTFEAYSEREIRRLNQMHDCMNQKGEVLISFLTNKPNIHRKKQYWPFIISR